MRSAMHDTPYKSILDHGLVNHCLIEGWWEIYKPE
jgi:hypothetical protein